MTDEPAAAIHPASRWRSVAFLAWVMLTTAVAVAAIRAPETARGAELNGLFISMLCSCLVLCCARIFGEVWVAAGLAAMVGMQAHLIGLAWVMVPCMLTALGLASYALGRAHLQQYAALEARSASPEGGPTDA